MSLVGVGIWDSAVRDLSKCQTAASVITLLLDKTTADESAAEERMTLLLSILLLNVIRLYTRLCIYRKDIVYILYD